MLVHGRVGLTTYTPEALSDERVLELARKVRYETKEYASYPAAFPGGVRITLQDGRTLEADFPHQLGAPENPMSAEQVREKFRENAALAGGSFEALEEAILTLEELDDVTRSLLRSSRWRRREAQLEIVARSASGSSGRCTRSRPSTSTRTSSPSRSSSR